MSSAPLLEIEGTLGPGDSRSHIPFSFDLSTRATSLELEFSFDPARLEDEARVGELASKAAGLFGLTASEAAARVRGGILNLLTLSLDGPEGFRGCAHRHGRRQLIRVGVSEASPGFMPGPLGAGTWRLVISVHCVVTERCDYRLVVRAEAGDGEGGGG